MTRLQLEFIKGVRSIKEKVRLLEVILTSCLSTAHYLLDYQEQTMGPKQLCLVVSFLCLAVNICLAEDDPETTTTTVPPTSERNGRKFIPLYEAPDRQTGETAVDLSLQASPRALPPGNYLPYRHAGSGVMKKSGTNVNWSVWKGDDNNSGDDGSDENDSPKWPHPPPSNWNNDPWAVDPTYLMMLKNAMADIKADQKPAGFLSKIGSDPTLLLIAASIPISLLLAAVLPAIMNMIMNGNSIPVISTTATGNKGRNQQVDIMPYLTPFMEAVGTFGVRSISNPECMQRIFCQVARDNIPYYESGYIRKVAGIARFVSSGSFLENYGVKDLVDSLGTGKCENIPCSNSKKATKPKSRYSRKLDENPDKQ